MGKALAQFGLALTLILASGDGCSTGHADSRCEDGLAPNDGKGACPPATRHADAWHVRVNLSR